LYNTDKDAYLGAKSEYLTTLKRILLTVIILIWLLNIIHAEIERNVHFSYL